MNTLFRSKMLRDILTICESSCRSSSRIVAATTSFSCICTWNRWQQKRFQKIKSYRCVPYKISVCPAWLDFEITIYGVFKCIKENNMNTNLYSCEQTVFNSLDNVRHEARFPRWYILLICFTIIQFFFANNLLLQQINSFLEGTLLKMKILLFTTLTLSPLSSRDCTSSSKRWASFPFTFVTKEHARVNQRTSAFNVGMVHINKYLPLPPLSFYSSASFIKRDGFLAEKRTKRTKKRTTSIN